MISRIAQTALILSGMGVMLALPAQAQQVVMTPEGTAFQVMPTVDPSNAMIAPTLPVIIGDGKVTPLPEPRDPNDPTIAPTLPVIIGDGKVTPLPGFGEFPPIVPGSYRGDLSITFPSFQVDDPGSVRVRGENGILERDAKLTNTPEKPLRELTREELSQVAFTTSARVLNNRFASVNARAAATPLIPNPNLRMINISENGSPLSASRIFPLPVK